MGAPDFAVPSLEALIAAGHTICGVFTQPDKPRNRNAKLQTSPAKVRALAHNIPVYQSVKLRGSVAPALIQELVLELIMAAAYGRILPNEIPAASPKGCINVHSSLLPRYRGAAPVHWIVLNGDSEIGVIIMRMAHDLDADDTVAQAVIPIDPDETVVVLHDRLVMSGAELLVNVVADIAAGTVTRTSQEHDRATLTPILSWELPPADQNRPARALHNQVRGLVPWPAAVTELGSNHCKVFSASVLDATTSAAPGTILATGREGVQAACREGTVLRVDGLQAGGSKRVKTADCLRGHSIPMG